MSIGAAGSSLLLSAGAFVAVAAACRMPRLALFDILLLNAGQPLQPSAPPVPLHFPPPGHVPEGVWSVTTHVPPEEPDPAEALAFGEIFTGVCRVSLATTLGGRFKLVGRSRCLAL